MASSPLCLPWAGVAWPCVCVHQLSGTHSANLRKFTEFTNYKAGGFINVCLYYKKTYLSSVFCSNFTHKKSSSATDRVDFFFGGCDSINFFVHFGSRFLRLRIVALRRPTVQWRPFVALALRKRCASCANRSGLVHPFSVAADFGF